MRGCQGVRTRQVLAWSGGSGDEGREWRVWRGASGVVRIEEWRGLNGSLNDKVIGINRASTMRDYQWH